MKKQPKLYALAICAAMFLTLAIMVPSSLKVERKFTQTASLTSDSSPSLNSLEESVTTSSNTPKTTETPTGNIEQQPVEEEPVEEPLQLQAKSACVFDASKKEYLFELNPKEQLPLASITKLMMALVAKEDINQETPIEITKEAVLQEGDSGLLAGETWKLKDLLSATLISSLNDGAFAIAASLSREGEAAERMFVNLMNKKAEELGLNKAHFLNSSGLDISETQAGGYGSCKDITKLMAYIIQNYPDLLGSTTMPEITVNGRTFKNTNKLLSELPVFFGGKTGYSDLAGGNLTVFVGKAIGHPIIITVLGSGYEERFDDIKTLYNRYAK